jgi:hypothetical protein
LLEEAGRLNKPLVVAADTNSHSMLWGESTNARGEEWEELILAHNLRVENMKNCPHTFENEQGHRSHIDVTLTRGVEVTEWKVCDGPMISEINFSVVVGPGDSIKHTDNRNKHNHKKCNWRKYEETVEKIVARRRS